MRISDWSSDVCSSDLEGVVAGAGDLAIDLAGRPHRTRRGVAALVGLRPEERKSDVSATSVSASVDTGGRRIIPKNKSIIPTERIINTYQRQPHDTTQ